MQTIQQQKKKLSNIITLLQQQKEIQKTMKDSDYSANTEAYFHLHLRLHSIEKDTQRIRRPQTFMETL